jgi:hypothetical protein
MLNIISLILLLSLSSCKEVNQTNQDIESPLQNTCQSGDLLLYFPKCKIGE